MGDVSGDEEDAWCGFNGDDGSLSICWEGNTIVELDMVVEDQK